MDEGSKEAGEESGEVVDMHSVEWEGWKREVNLWDFIVMAETAGGSREPEPQPFNTTVSHNRPEWGRQGGFVETRIF